MSAENVVPRGRLLLVDDDADLRESLRELLSDDGYDVACAINGQDALAQLRSGTSIDLILLDLMMPVMDGWQFRIEQKRDPKLGGVPVVALSAEGSAQAAAIDSDLYLRKPFNYANLCSSIDRILRARRAPASDRMASLSKLAAGISHEVNNPLSYVMMNLRYVAEELPRLMAKTVEAAKAWPPQQDVGEVEQITSALGEAYDGADRIRKIVADVGSVSRIYDSPRARIDVERALESSIAIASSQFRAPFKVIRMFGSVPAVQADEGGLRRVFVNLLVNAAQAIEPSPGIEPEIRVVTRTDRSGDAVIEISDNGTGIPTAIQDRIFEPFFTTKPIGSGTGLGLWICHGIVTALGGEISFDSLPGRGSTFRLRLPASREANAQASRGSAPAASPEEHLARLLIVDDEPTLLRVLVRSIGKHVEVKDVGSARAALSVLETDTRFDAILCDLMMDEMTGIQLYEELQRRHPGMEKRVIFMTGAVVSGRAAEFLSREGLVPLLKPFGTDELRAAVAEKLDVVR